MESVKDQPQTIQLNVEVAEVEDTNRNELEESSSTAAGVNDNGRIRTARFWEDILDGREKSDDPIAILAGDMRIRAQRANPRLEALLQSTVKIICVDSKREIIIDLKTKANPVVLAPLSQTECGCSLKISEVDLVRVAAGELNPQLGMLTDRIRVSGATELAVYVFNLIAPAISSR